RLQGLREAVIRLALEEHAQHPDRRRAALARKAEGQFGDEPAQNRFGREVLLPADELVELGQRVVAALHAVWLLQGGDRFPARPTFSGGASWRWAVLRYRLGCT